MGGHLVTRYDFALLSAADRRAADRLQTKINRLRQVLLRAKADTMTLKEVRTEIRQCHKRIDHLEKRIAIIEGRPR